MSDRPTDGAHDRVDAPIEDRPEGAIPTPDDAETYETYPKDGEEPMIGTADDGVREMVTASGSVIDVVDVRETIEQIEEETAVVEEPEPEADDEDRDPPGMPHQPDGLDREMAARAHEAYLFLRHGPDRERVRPDQATVVDARLGAIYDTRAHSVREALLIHIKDMADEERKTLRRYADALREVQESRDYYVHCRDARLGAEEALFMLGADVEGDHEQVEPTVETIPDHVIV